MFITVFWFGTFLLNKTKCVFTSACFSWIFLCQRAFLCQSNTLPQPAMERIRLSKKKSCFASFISALLISWASDGSLTVLMIGDDKLRTLSRSPIRSVAELDVINLILHFLHLPQPPPPLPPRSPPPPPPLPFTEPIATHTHSPWHIHYRTLR